MVESAGRKVPSRILDISERGAKITCVPGLALGTIGKLTIEGVSQALGFVVRSGTLASSSVEVEAEGAVREQYLNWLARVTGSRAAA